MVKQILGAVALVFSLSATAQTDVKVFWPFSAVSDQGLMIKELVDSANQKQQKFKFEFVHKPGAGGSLAVKSIQAEDSLSVLVHTSSFYIRPNLVKDAHDISDFKMINTICTDQPLSIVSRKFKSLKDFENNTAKVGLNPGSITSLVPRNLSANNPKIKIVEVPYKGTPEATNDMLGGHIDGSIDFIGPATVSRLPDDVRILGITGTKSMAGFKTFKEQGYVGLDDITNSYYIFVKSNIDSKIAVEISEVLYQAISQQVKQYCEAGRGTVTKIPQEKLQGLNAKNVEIWKKATASFAQK
jgi:tripartite-type tricarboxylate transporter receptor subunit TctC